MPTNEGIEKLQASHQYYSGLDGDSQVITTVKKLTLEHQPAVAAAVVALVAGETRLRNHRDGER